MSLDLDKRQRAMLQEMNVHVWWPQPTDAAVLAMAPAPVPVASAPARHAAASPRGAPTAAHSVDAGLAALAALPVVTAASQSAPHGSTSANPQDPSIATLGWSALQQAVSTCRACPLCEARKNTVFGVGEPAAQLQAAPQVDWLVVGEAPDEEEDRTGEPFAGQAGQLLDNMLKAMGVSRQHNVFLVSVVKCRPPGNRNPEPQEIAQCEPFLRRQIELLQPKVILAMGRYAMNSLLQMSVPDVHKMPLGKLRGQVYGYASAGRSIPVIATYHPAYLLRNLPEKAKAWADLCLAMQAMQALGQLKQS